MDDSAIVSAGDSVNVVKSNVFARLLPSSANSVHRQILDERMTNGNLP